MNDLKDTTLSQLDYQKAIVENTILEIEKIRGISSVLAMLKTITKRLMDEQIKDITQQFDFINNELGTSVKKQIEEFRNQSTELNKTVNQRLRDQVKNLEETVSNMHGTTEKSLENMHLGAVKNTVIQVVNSITKKWVDEITSDLVILTRDIQSISSKGLENTIKSLEHQLVINKKVTDAGLERTTQDINSQMISNMEKSMKKTIDDVNEIITSSGTTGTELKNFFSDITESFGGAVSMAGEKITEISDEIIDSFRDLKSLFLEKVLNTFTEVLKNILQKLEISETTTNEFWEQAKQVSLVTMKNIWFIKSIEGAKAHTLDQLPKAKMRILIIVPQITDIDVDALKNDCSPHVNIRIVANIDLHDSEHLAVMVELEKLTNVALRRNEKENLWGVNRDTEEVIVCVLSKTEIAGLPTTEIAGIGSQIDEHIKIFAPILEDAWIGGAKDILQRAALQKPPSAAHRSAPVPTPRLLVEEDVEAVPTPPEPKKAKPPPPTLIEAFDSITNQIDELTGHQVVVLLTNLRDTIFETKGFSTIMSKINQFNIPFKKIKGQLDSKEKQELSEQLEFWKKMLEIYDSK